jgi:hypothetical protein
MFSSIFDESYLANFHRPGVPTEVGLKPLIFVGEWS